MSQDERMLALAQGIPGAIVALATLKNEYPHMVETVVDTLEKLNIRGSEIWSIFKQKCNRNIGQFVAYKFVNHRPLA